MHTVSEATVGEAPIWDPYCNLHRTTQGLTHVLISSVAMYLGYLQTGTTMKQKYLSIHPQTWRTKGIGFERHDMIIGASLTYLLTY